MTTKTTISLSPIKRSYGSSNLKKRRVNNRKPQMNISLTKLPDLINDILIDEQRRETILNIATTLRKVGDQIDEQLQINNNSSLSSPIDHIFSQRTMTFVYCLSHVLRFFL